MKEFLHRFVYLHIKIDNKDFYYTHAYITEITDSHLSFKDNFNNPCTYRIIDVVEIKLSNKNEVNNGN